MHGKGVFSWPDGRKYEGEYLNDLKHGQGKFEWPSGKMYDGSWADGKQDGPGIYRARENDKLREGVWEKGQRVKWIESSR